MKLTPKNWSAFQHYKGRTPPWIKLHRTLLDDYEFVMLPTASRALAPLLWLLASEYHGGVIDAPPAKIAFRVHMTLPEFEDALKPLIDGGFFTVASMVIARRKRDDHLEEEAEREEEAEKKDNLFAGANGCAKNLQNRSAPKVRKRSTDDDPSFLEFYSAYPRKQSKLDASKAYNQVRKSNVSHETIMAGLERAKRSDSRFREQQYTPLPASWLRAGGFEDEPNGKAAGQRMTHAEAERFALA